MNVNLSQLILYILIIQNIKTNIVISYFDFSRNISNAYCKNKYII